MTEATLRATEQDEQNAKARRALERVCARGDFDAAQDLYRSDFIDHVSRMEFVGTPAFANLSASTTRSFRIFGSRSKIR